MKIREITLRGFRGFNSECSIPIHDRLTLISAPNSHGKTSISEGFEWLLYGYTSKVQFADSKDEYRGSYRNIHLLQPEVPVVKMVVDDGQAVLELQALLSGTEAVLRVNGSIVDSWPFASKLDSAPKPFILQHALKDLLHAAPVDRFNRFAALLGFEELTRVHKDLLAFCTKPPLPLSAKELSGNIDGLVVRLQADPQLAPIARSIRKGHAELAATRSLIKKHARNFVGSSTPDAGLLLELVKKKDQATSKFFSGSVGIGAFTDAEVASLAEEEKTLLGLVRGQVATLFIKLAAESAQHAILREAEFYGLGIELFEQSPSICPFCNQQLTAESGAHIRDKHGKLIEAKAAVGELANARQEIGTVLADFSQRVTDYYKRIAGRSKPLLDAQASQKQLDSLLSGKNTQHLGVITQAMQDFGTTIATFVESGKKLRSALRDVESAVSKPISDLTLVEALGQAAVHYLAAGTAVKSLINTHAAGLTLANKALAEELNSVAGTNTISLLIELLENDRKLEKRLRIAAATEDLKELKTDADTFVMKIMLDAISGELADEVMGWYNRIRTVGDPDVHFAGFDMKKTPQGSRVQIKASSYGKDMVSAVSSLSESKLNALGLCISIAINLKEASPFQFLIIDDPIQSWDKDHELQFINVIRELIERGKQVVLLSHNGEWIRQVRTVCADFNGLYYEITGYNEEGPIIRSFPWVEPKQRLQTILAVLEDQSADSIRLQQAEEELRQILHQLTCTLFEGVKKQPKNPATLNAAKVRKILTECGIDLPLLNKVMAIFETLDDAHHAAPGYSPNRQKLRQYYDTAVRLSQTVEAKLKESKPLAVVVADKTA
jgi:hypothetical protein